MGIIARLFGREGGQAPAVDPRLGEMVERVIALSPRLRLASRCQPRLETAVGKGLACIRGLVASWADAREASAAAWSSDPCIRAFFGAPDDVSRVIAQSQPLRALFDANPSLAEAHAVLGMAFSERRTLGVALEGQATRHDVEQTTVSFGDHKLRLCGPDIGSLAEEVVGRLVDQLMLEALARVAADTSRRDDLEQERALLTTRLRLLERQGTGMRSMVGADGAAPAQDAARLREQLEQNDAELRALGTRAETLDRQLETVCTAFSDAEQLLQVAHRRMHLSRMNVLLSESDAADGAGAEVEFDIARVPGDPPQERAFVLVRLHRSQLGDARNPLDEADRLLV
jgi:hypothetical protein